MQQTKVRFPGPDTFRQTLNARVEADLAAKGLSQRDAPSMYLKTFIMAAWVFGTYALLLQGGRPWYQDILLCVSFGFAQAGFVFNVGHDGNHGAYSSKPWINTLMGGTFDLVGASGFLWRFRHNVIHHTYTNIAGVDFDISSSAPFFRTTNLDPWYPIHRFQHFYCWILYGFLTMNWAFTDLYAFITGRYMTNKIPTPTRANYVSFIVSRIGIITTIFVLPLASGRSFIEVAVGIFVTHWIMGFTLAIIFQLAHVLEVNNVVYPPSADFTTDDAFAAHQLKTTADFAPNNWLANWYLGGLNFQAVHHLFPKITHVRYPHMYRVIEEVAREHGVPYVVYPTVRAALASHFRVMKKLSERPEAAAAAHVPVVSAPQQLSAP